MLVYENNNYKVIIDYVTGEDGENSPYKSYLVINKVYDVVEGTHNVFCAARDMADDFSVGMDKGSKLEEQVPGEDAPDAPQLNS